MKDLRPGQAGRVKALCLPPERATGLIRLGLVPGASVRCLRRTPLGDPAVYELRGTALALRAGDAARVEIDPVPDRGCPHA